MGRHQLAPLFCFHTRIRYNLDAHRELELPQSAKMQPWTACHLPKHFDHKLGQVLLAYNVQKLRSAYFILIVMGSVLQDTYFWIGNQYCPDKSAPAFGAVRSRPSWLRN